MLCLGRKESESVLILTPEGRLIQVMLVARGKVSRIGFVAEPDVQIMRAEIAPPAWRELAARLKREGGR